MFFITLDFILFIFLANECVRKTYPKFHNDLLINLIYYCVYFYSTAQEVYNNMYPLFVNEDILVNNLQLILDNDDNYITDTEEIIIDQNVPEDYMFAVYMQLNNDKTMRKMRIYKTVPNDGIYDCDETNYKFILIEVKYDNYIFKVNFENVNSTYYVVNNEFDSKVIRYLLIKELGIELPEKYSIRILDQNVNRFEFNETQVLRLNKNNYEVIDAYDTDIECENDNDESENGDESENDDESENEFENNKII